MTHAFASALSMLMHLSAIVAARTTAASSRVSSGSSNVLTFR